jgi:hypothetical protein
MMESFNLAKNTLVWRGFVGISQDYPLKTRPSKQPTGDISGYGIILSNPLKYPRSKQGLRNLGITRYNSRKHANLILPPTHITLR